MKQYDGIKDEELIFRFKNGESEILDYLMEKYKNMVRKKARTMFLIGGENDDLIQEGMIGLFKAVRDYQPDQMPHFRLLRAYAWTDRFTMQSRVLTGRNISRLTHMSLSVSRAERTKNILVIPG